MKSRRTDFAATAEPKTRDNRLRRFWSMVLVTAVFAAVTALSAGAQDDDDPLKPYQSSYTPVTGAYEVSPGHIVVVVIAAGGAPQYIDLQSGRFANLSPTPPGVLTDKVDTEVSFQPGSGDGRAGMQWKQGAGGPVFARRLNLRSENFEFRDGDVCLAISPSLGRFTDSPFSREDDSSVPLETWVITPTSTQSSDPQRRPGAREGSPVCVLCHNQTRPITIRPKPLLTPLPLYG